MDPCWGRYEWDAEKCARNVADQKPCFELVLGFDWATARSIPDDREDYGEPRVRSLGYAGDRLHMLVWTPRPPSIRVISFRRANSREVTRYEDGTE